LIVVNSQSEIVPAYGLELLQELVRILEDFCGPISEKVIRKDLVLIYEILDEFFDFGYAGVTNTDEMTRHIEYQKEGQGMVSALLSQAS
jgi:AP-4 complex subunit mu-1